MLRILMALLLSLSFVTLTNAQDADAPDRTATGGAQTLEDIMARQRGETVDDSFRSEAIGNPDSAAGVASQLGTLGGASDPELWRALRFGEANITSTSNGPAATTLIQDGGMEWLLFRQGPLLKYGSYLLGGTLLTLALFFLIRGRIRIDGEKTGNKIERFKAVERFGHWLLAGSFILLGITGLVSLFGRKVLIPAGGDFRDVGHPQPTPPNRHQLVAQRRRNFLQRAPASQEVQCRAKADFLVGDRLGHVHFCFGSGPAVPVRNQHVRGNIRQDEQLWHLWSVGLGRIANHPRPASRNAIRATLARHRQLCADGHHSRTYLHRDSGDGRCRRCHDVRRSRRTMGARAPFDLG